MSKFLVAALAALTLSAAAFAGGDIAPVVEVETAEVVVDKDFYVGISTTIGDSIVQSDFETFTSTGYGIQAGYTFYRNEAFDVAVEGRYTAIVVGPLEDFGDYQTYGAFIKPGYDFGALKAYALLGYTAVDKPQIDVDGFAVGLGLSTEVYGYELFVDYVANDADYDRFVDGDYNNEIVSVGVNYSF